MNFTKVFGISICSMALLTLLFNFSRLSWVQKGEESDEDTLINVTSLASATPTIYAATRTNTSKLLILGVTKKQLMRENDKISVLAVEVPEHQNIARDQSYSGFGDPKLWTVPRKSKEFQPFRQFVRLFEINWVKAKLTFTGSKTGSWQW